MAERLKSCQLRKTLRRIPPYRHPNFEKRVKERYKLFLRNPKTTFVAAHMGWHANVLACLGKMLTQMPNVDVDVGGCLYQSLHVVRLMVILRRAWWLIHTSRPT
jgi:hypothetical protein